MRAQTSQPGLTPLPSVLWTLLLRRTDIKFRTQLPLSGMRRSPASEMRSKRRVNGARCELASFLSSFPRRATLPLLFLSCQVTRAPSSSCPLCSFVSHCPWCGPPGLGCLSHLAWCYLLSAQFLQVWKFVRCYFLKYFSVPLSLSSPSRTVTSVLSV